MTYTTCVKSPTARGYGVFTVTDDTREITATEAGALAGVSAQIVLRAVRDGRLKPKRIVGKSYLFDLRDVDQWIRARARDGEPGKFPETSN